MVASTERPTFAAPTPEKVLVKEEKRKPAKSVLEVATKLAESGAFMPPLTSNGEFSLTLFRKWFNDGGDRWDLAVDSFLVSAKKGKDKVRILLDWFVRDDCIRLLGERDYRQSEWVELSKEYEKDVMLLPAEKRLPNHAFLTFLSYVFVDHFYKYAAESGFIPKALAVLGHAVRCNPNLDISAIVANVPNSSHWHERLKKMDELDIKLIKPVDHQEGTNITPEEAKSYFFVFCFYLRAKQRPISAEDSTLLKTAFDENNNIDVFRCYVEGAHRHFVRLHNLCVDKYEVFLGLTKQVKGHDILSPEVLASTGLMKEINACEQLAKELQDVHWAPGYMESAFLYLNIAVLGYNTDNIDLAKTYFRKTFFCLYMAETLVKNNVYAQASEFWAFNGEDLCTWLGGRYDSYKDIRKQFKEEYDDNTLKLKDLKKETKHYVKSVCASFCFHKPAQESSFEPKRPKSLAQELSMKAF